MGYTKKYSYNDWWNGKIYFGGTIIFDSEEEKPLFDKVSKAKYSELPKMDSEKVKKKQKKIFWEDVDDWFSKVKNYLNKLYKESEEREKLLRGNYNDLVKLFFGELSVSDKPNILFPWLQKEYSQQEIIWIQSFYWSQIVKGKRFYSFIQSPNQQLKIFRTPPIEVEAEVMYKYYKLIEKKLLQFTNPKIESHGLKKKKRKNKRLVKKKLLSNNKISEPKRLEELFSMAERNICFDALMKTEPPILDINFNYRLGERQKGAVVAWCQAMKIKGKMQQVGDVLLAKLLNRKIKNLNFGMGRSLRNHGTTAYRKYYNQILILIS